MKLSPYRQVIRWGLSFLFIAAICLGSQAASQADDDESGKPHVGRAQGKIVVFRKGASPHERTDAEKKIVKERGGHLGRNLPLVNGRAISLPDAAAERIVGVLRNHPAVERVDDDLPFKIASRPNGITSLSRPPDEIIPWGVRRVLSDPDQIWRSSTGSRIKIAVIDTGIDLRHPDLSVAGGISLLEGTKKKSYDDDNGHGTHIAGIIGAALNKQGVVGVAHAAILYAVKLLNKNGFGKESDLIAALEWCLDHGIQIANMSFGSDKDNLTLREAITKAAQSGLIMVAAAGNHWNFFTISTSSLGTQSLLGMGEGTEAFIKQGEGTESFIKSGEGTESYIPLGEGTEALIMQGEGTESFIIVGEGTEAFVRQGEGTEVVVTLGEGTEAFVTKGEGTESVVTLGEGTEAVIRRLGEGTEVVIRSGEGTENAIILGEGTEAFVRQGEGTETIVTLGEGTELVIRRWEGSGTFANLGEGTEALVRRAGEGTEIVLRVGEGTEHLLQLGEGTEVLLKFLPAQGPFDPSVLYPAAYPETIAVVATDSHDQIAPFNNYGPEVTLAAPGVEIISTIPGGGYGIASGSSMATAHVTGAIALLLEAKPGLTLDSLIEGLRQSWTENLGASADRQGYGLMNAGCAFDVSICDQ
ncbi:MAG: S8 family serine peptidase [Candidatus Tectomicrobia bacterium]|nr:S8 family serine peptidase [Candidatus Tectomicrobia bacterium]